MIDEKDSLIISFIYQNPKCEYFKLKKALERKMTRHTLLKRVKHLIRFNHIFSLETRKVNGKTKLYPNILIVNLDKLYEYPELLLTCINELQTNNHSIMENDLENDLKHQFMLNFMKNTDVVLFKEDHFAGKNEDSDFSSSNRFYFSDKKSVRFNELMQTLLYDTILNNPEVWYSIQEPKDLDFYMILKTKWSIDPELFSIFNERKKNTDENLELLYAKAKMEHQKFGTEKEKELKYSLRKWKKLGRDFRYNRNIYLIKLEQIRKKQTKVISGLIDNK